MNRPILKNPLKPLLDFGEKLGIPKEIWIEREELEQLIYTNSELTQDSASRLTLQQIAILIEAYDDAITCRFLLGDLVVLEIVPGLNETALDKFKAKIHRSPIVKLDIKLDKAKLIRNWLGDVPWCNLFLYLSPNALEHFLNNDLSKLESRLWGPEASSNKVIILVPCHDIFLDGEYLAIVGGEYSEDWGKVVPSERRDNKHLKYMYNTCREALRWQEPWLKYLTPLHLRIDTRSIIGDPISKVLRIHLINSIILYTADKTIIRDDGRYVATYTSSNQSIEVVLADTRNYTGDAYYGVGCLFQMLVWIYDPHWSTDRIPFAQISIVQSLYAADPKIRYDLLVHNAPNIFNGVQWHWKAFIEEKIDDYMSQVKDLEDYVTKTAQAFADQVSSIIKNLSDTMLAAIGALLGSFIAALFQSNFNATVFMIGMLIYAVYVLIFPLGYNMLSQRQRYLYLVKDFENHRHRFEGQLYPKKVDEIIGSQIKDSRMLFDSWFNWTICGYLAIIFSALIAAWLIPGIIGQTVHLSAVNITTISP